MGGLRIFLASLLCLVYVQVVLGVCNSNLTIVPGIWHDSGHTETLTCDLCGRTYSFWVSDNSNFILCDNNAAVFSCATLNSYDSIIENAELELQVTEFPEDNLEVFNINIFNKNVELCEECRAVYAEKIGEMQSKMSKMFTKWFEKAKKDRAETRAALQKKRKLESIKQKGNEINKLREQILELQKDQLKDN